MTYIDGMTFTPVKPVVLTQWDKLILRLQSIANNKEGNKYNQRYEGTAFIMVNLIYSDNVLIGWHKPQRIEIEPKTFDYTELNIKRLDNWNDVLRDLQQGKNDCTLIVKDGYPVGWLK